MSCRGLGQQRYVGGCVPPSAQGCPRDHAASLLHPCSFPGCPAWQGGAEGQGALMGLCLLQVSEAKPMTTTVEVGTTMAMGPAVGLWDGGACAPPHSTPLSLRPTGTVTDTGTIAGIASGLAMALIGAVTSYISYQQKKFCFSIQRKSSLPPPSISGAQSKHILICPLSPAAIFQPGDRRGVSSMQ